MKLGGAAGVGWGGGGAGGEGWGWLGSAGKSHSFTGAARASDHNSTRFETQRDISVHSFFMTPRRHGDAASRARVKSIVLLGLNGDGALFALGEDSIFSMSSYPEMRNEMSSDGISFYFKMIRYIERNCSGYVCDRQQLDRERNYYQI